MKLNISTPKKLFGNILGFMIFALIYLSLDYLTPYLKQSPVFNGVMSAAGVVLLLVLPLLSLVDRRPSGRGEWFQTVLGIFGCTLLDSVFYLSSPDCSFHS